MASQAIPTMNIKRFLKKRDTNMLNLEEEDLLGASLEEKPRCV